MRIVFDWTDDRIARLAELDALQWSAAQIAADLGCSRGAVIGKRDRLRRPARERRKSCHWPPERRDELAALRRCGLNVRQIADKLDCSVVAVYKAFSRYGIARPPRPKRVPAAPADRPAVKAFRPVRRGAPLLEPQGARLTLLQLTATSCRWPYGDSAPYLFCGAATDGEGSYCRYHRQLACSWGSALFTEAAE